jgi:hypothetical protein
MQILQERARIPLTASFFILYPSALEVRGNMNKGKIKVLTDDEAESLGLVQKALQKCEPEDLLVGFVKDHNKYYAIIYTVKPRRRYLHRLQLR